MVKRILATLFALVACWSVVCPSPAWADGDDSRLWLEQARPGTTLNENIDIALGLVAAGSSRQVVDQQLAIVAFLYAATGKPGNLEVAKLTVLSHALNKPTDQWLGAKLPALASEPASGQFESPFGLEIHTQSWGIMAKIATGQPFDAEAKYLVSRQCPDGSMVADPSHQNCHGGANKAAQALALNALAWAQSVAPNYGSALTKLTQWHQVELGRAGLPGSGLAYAAGALAYSGEKALSSQAVQQLAALKLTTWQPGAMGGQTKDLADDLVKQQLYPSPSATAEMIIGLHATSIPQLHYRPTTASKPSPKMVVATPVVASGSPIAVLGTGLKPNTSYELKTSSPTSALETRTTDATGSAKFNPKITLNPGQYRLSLGTLIDHIEVTGQASDPYTDTEDTSALLRPPTLSWPTLGSILAAIMAFMVAASLHMSRRNHDDRK
ncbi:hypothetical protein O6R08_10385 [Cutibacterium equinum]|uniref:Squalene cyclase C-terminal domain-containing protein n=1 Tax=Cutibacterium equinum TaxID=3016342 RepID=A0ABY7QXT0_9ACTN|nr:hypothetical protein [Cutibacterium equinum]WCC79852.1 hypothetical protein O6R08_10385 [Cutibacterium equinum]